MDSVKIIREQLSLYQDGLKFWKDSMFIAMDNDNEDQISACIKWINYYQTAIGIVQNLLMKIHEVCK